jgi:hypothetical protein
MTLETRRLWLLAGALAGYGLMLFASPIRGSLRDGWRCVRRYKQICGIPAFCGVAHAVFQFGVRCYEAWLIPASLPAIRPWAGWQPPTWAEAMAASRLPTLESAAALFNCLVTVFPLSAPAAVLFLVNWRGYQWVLLRALVRRLGWIAGLAVYLGLIVCALAALAKPVLFLGGLQRLSLYYDGNTALAIGAIVNWLSFLFEYVLGVGVQIYLVLLCYVWIRGLTFDFVNLRRFALRRFVFVFKWAVIVIALSSVSIDLPLIVAAFRPPPPGPEAGGMTAFLVARGVLASLLLAFCTMQMTLILHNESLRRALRDHWAFLRRHGWDVLWLVILAAVNFFLLAAADACLTHGLGASTWPTLAWTLFVQPVTWAGLGGWLLASWVCLYRRCQTHRADGEELVRF